MTCGHEDPSLYHHRSRLEEAPAPASRGGFFEKEITSTHILSPTESFVHWAPSHHASSYSGTAAIKGSRIPLKRLRRETSSYPLPQPLLQNEWGHTTKGLLDDWAGGLNFPGHLFHLISLWRYNVSHPCCKIYFHCSTAFLVRPVFLDDKNYFPCNKQSTSALLLQCISYFHMGMGRRWHGGVGGGNESCTKVCGRPLSATLRASQPKVSSSVEVSGSWRKMLQTQPAGDPARTTLSHLTCPFWPLCDFFSFIS